MKNLFLRAKLHNWGLICWDASWISKTWHIYENGVFRFSAEYGCYIDEGESSRRSTKRRTQYGRMSPEELEKLKNAVNCDPWKDPNIRVTANDGVAWEIDQYTPDRLIYRSNWGPDYIYGHRNLEKIVSCLPMQEMVSEECAFVCVRIKKDDE